MTKTIVAIGEALWDVFPDQRRPGGAPCNVAFHAAQLGDRGVIITRVGGDADGDELVAYLRQRGVDTRYMQRDATRPTGTVVVKLTHISPRYDITNDVAWDYIAPEDAASGLAAEADAICVGSLAQRSSTTRATIRQLLSDAHGKALIVFDVNLRPPFTDPEVILTTFVAADVTKMSASEVAEVSTMLDRPSLAQWLVESVGVQAVCVTRGEKGASITTSDGTVSVPGIEVDASAGDPVGAGDAFTAAMTCALVRQATPEQALVTANRYAALVATKPGAMPVLSAEELAEIGL
ncbi:MAG: carbohydrate kinase [Gemmatimonadota bacterium]|nr:carbohydrate kinase [Gemmatimonadota bacterium]